VRTADSIDEGLLDAAHSAIKLYGWSGATLERIATEAGVSRMTLHRRGVTRQRLLGALSDRLEKDHAAALLPALAHQGTGRERLEIALVAELAHQELFMELSNALGAAGHDAIYLADGEEALTRDAFTDPFKVLLLDGIADGTLRASDPEETATVLLNLVSHIYRHLRTGHDWEPERAGRAVITFALAGVTP
jgi:AcrR family transcriptional regulator